MFETWRWLFWLEFYYIATCLPNIAIIEGYIAIKNGDIAIAWLYIAIFS